MSSKERDQLHAEFSILASLKHPNIVGYYHREHLKQTQELYLYMEYCGGGDLGSIIKDLKKKREYPKEEFVWRILSQLVTALYRCHYGVDPPEPGSDFARQKDTRTKAKDMILHRDLKPENIFLGADQAVKLGDFGLSKLMQSHDFASTYVGTPFYMSPEICASERYTLLSDIWSVGCIIYELCTHNPPFNANSHLQLIQRIRKGDFAPIPSVYSKDLSNVISQCLKVNPNNRPDTASLLTVPYIWLARRQQEMVGLGKALKTREEVAEQKLRQAEERLSAMEADQAAMRVEIENQVRREWEVKARLEITRQVNLEVERLRAQFDDEVEKKVAALLNEAKHTENGIAKETTAQSQKGYSSSVNTFGEEEFPSTTDLTDLSDLSIHSPTSSTIKPLPQKKTKTPFSRSKTTFDSPMDVQMSEPSPMSISGLALSPRRNAAAQATANSTTTAYSVRNIFAEAARQKAKWEPTLAYESENDENVDPSSDFSDDDGIPELPSPTRVKPTVASTDPFKQPLPPRTRPALGRVHTVAATQRLTTKPNLFPTNNLASAKAEAVKASIAAAAAQQQASYTNTHIPRSATETDLLQRRPTSPNRRLSKIPTQPLDGAFVGSTSPIRRTNTTGKLQSKLASARDGNVPAVGGRTLVELAQARAGGRPMSGDFAGGNVGFGNGTLKSKQVFGGLEEKDLPPVPVWDPEAEGENMPSPFLKRDVRSLPRGLR
jgi:NIMA (never in mitosis gene a)-related kinase 2